VVTFVSATGSLTDRSSTWAAGTVTTSTSITLSTPGTMWICPGTYAVSLTVSGGTDLYGPYGSESTILTGRGGKRVVLATSNMDLEGLTITDGYSSSSYGGGLYSNGYDISLVDVVFSDNQAVYGGGLAVRNGDLTADSVEIANNTATSQGGGLYMSTNATLVADLMVLSGNDATYGGGIYATSADIEMVDSELSTNLADTSGGALYLASSSAADLTTSEVTGNTAGDYGGGVYQSASDLTLTRSNLSTNDASLLGGGAYLAGASDLSCTGTSTPVYGIWGNTALLAGGAYVAASTGRIYSSVCDWTASSDNDLYDIVLGSTYLAYSKGNNATFTCTSTGC
jgi:predicted outer membrane repeat protein